ncbi:class I SAM-dependent methyltransferase [Bradyrhizobium sp. WSM471]|uniref:class I SAM-dependent methyltransferase n=1 Tax=Bradyrhizobium sp. WSM471 TaxID=319017 RepID=UPI00024D2C21|nr:MULTISPECIES: class I SAM-dependent methyltransferase [Bradyrhizobium]EHR04620.1 methyltransferase family protein [Bradyrhizobium sp. WSM471]UFW39769.1 class I SAM-dependent methyltransferase [Bradyrhizobium canariense]
MTKHFLEVTELPGEEISQEQLERLCHRYYWAAQYVQNRDVLEVACGAGPGLRYLAQRARSVTAGDLSPEILARAQQHAGSDVELRVFDAQDLPYGDASFDTVIIFEALYYVSSAERFMAEAKRVLRPGGQLLISNANRDLYDFNPSPHSAVYHGVVGLRELLDAANFRPLFFGYLKVDQISFRQKLLRPIKKIAVDLNLMPATMQSKKLLKRFVFGQMVPMPDSVIENLVSYHPPEQIDATKPDRIHKVLYCAATSL